MASVFHLCSDAVNIKQKIVTKYADYAAIDKKLYFSAVAIQKTWRGYVVRKMIKFWHANATTIQRFIRGWLTRLHLPDYLQDYYYILSVRFYNKCATKIQALWRGHRDRKIVNALKSLLAERQEIEMLSKRMQEEMRKAFEKLKSGPWSESYQYLEKIIKILLDRHHLLRTYMREGVFSIHGSKELSCLEKILKSFPLLEYMNKMKSKQKKSLHDSVPSRLPSKPFILSPRLEAKAYERFMLTQDK